MKYRIKQVDEETFIPQYKLGLLWCDFEKGLKFQCYAWAKRHIGDYIAKKGTKYPKTFELDI